MGVRVSHRLLLRSWPGVGSCVKGSAGKGSSSKVMLAELSSLRAFWNQGLRSLMAVGWMPAM